MPVLGGPCGVGKTVLGLQITRNLVRDREHAKALYLCYERDQQVDGNRDHKRKSAVQPRPCDRRVTFDRVGRRRPRSEGKSRRDTAGTVYTGSRRIGIR